VGLLMFLLFSALVGLIVQVSRLRTESTATTKKMLVEFGKVTADGTRIRGLLAEASQALSAMPTVAASLSSADLVPALTRGLAEVADQFVEAREEVNRSAMAVCNALQTATDAHLTAAEEFENRGARVVSGIEHASDTMASVAAELRETTKASVELHEALRSNAVSFQMVQELIQRMDDLMPQVSASSQSLARLIERVEEKNLFGERVFADFESSLTQLSDAVVDLAALSRTFASQLDHQPQTMALASPHDENGNEPPSQAPPSR
jgi:chromosome segregation ATPase